MKYEQGCSGIMSRGGDVTNIRSNRQVLRLILVLFKAGDFVLSPPEIHFGKMFFWWLFNNVALAMKWSTTVWMFEWRSFYDLSVWWCNQSTLRLCRLSQQTRVSPPDVQEKKKERTWFMLLRTTSRLRSFKQQARHVLVTMATVQDQRRAAGTS